MLDAEIDRFVQIEGGFERMPPDPDGLIRSVAFPGLWLDPTALVGGDLAAVIEAVRRGLASPEHEAFVARLRG